MIFFITCLRALAACLITNSHYTGIYPTDLIANGGLLGDVIFFAVSGYCLYNIKFNFKQWYFKRVYRVYLPVIIATAVFMFLGMYTLENYSVFWWYLYPTNYHFVASIIVLYIPYYFIMNNESAKNNIGRVMSFIFGLMIMVYLFGYDKTYYHIDVVREPFIRFLFFEAMLLGAWFKVHDMEIRNKFSIISCLLLPVAGFIYIASKLTFSRTSDFSSWQIFNQISLFILLYLIMRIFSGIDLKLERLPEKIKRIINFISEITLEIYVVQYVLIGFFRHREYFPLNLILVTTAILLSAYILHKICSLIYKIIEDRTNINVRSGSLGE